MSGLTSANVESSLLTEEVDRKNLDNTCSSGNAITMRGRSNDKGKVAIWLARLVGDLGISVEVSTLHCDSQSVIMLAKNLVFHAKTKNVDMKHHFIWYVLEDKHMELLSTLHTTGHLWASAR